MDKIKDWAGAVASVILVVVVSIAGMMVVLVMIALAALPFNGYRIETVPCQIFVGEDECHFANYLLTQKSPEIKLAGHKFVVLHWSSGPTEDHYELAVPSDIGNITIWGMRVDTSKIKLSDHEVNTSVSATQWVRKDYPYRDEVRAAGVALRMEQINARLLATLRAFEENFEEKKE